MGEGDGQRRSRGRAGGRHKARPSPPPSLPSSSSSSSRSAPAGKPSPALVRGATARPRLRDLRGGPARGKGRRPRRPHPWCLHPAPGEVLGRGRGLCGVRGAGCCCSHRLLLRRGPEGRERESVFGGLWGRVGEGAPGSGTPGLGQGDLPAPRDDRWSRQGQGVSLSDL